MLETKFNTEDEFGILPGSENGKKVPYYSIKLTQVQAREVRDKKPMIYCTLEKEFFEVRGLDGKPTGELMLFVVFV